MFWPVNFVLEYVILMNYVLDLNTAEEYALHMTRLLEEGALYMCIYGKKIQ